MPFISKKLYAHEQQMGITLLMNELGLTRSESQRSIHRGRLSQNGLVMNDPFGMVIGEYDFLCFEPLSQGLKPFFITDDFAVYDKPHFLSVHPQSRKSPCTLTDDIKHQFGNDANAAHRIDYETSGLVLVSLHKESEPFLKRLFSERSISKRYYAMVRGEVSSSFEIHEPLYHIDHPNLLVSMVVRVDPRGKDARTLINPLQYFKEYNMTFIEAIPHTGYTHQIRAHLFHVKHPIIGDPVYGPKDEDVIRYINKEISREERLEKYGCDRLLLHAQSLEFEYQSIRYRIDSEKDFLNECFEAMHFNPIKSC